MPLPPLIMMVPPAPRAFVLLVLVVPPASVTPGWPWRLVARVATLLIVIAVRAVLPVVLAATDIMAPAARAPCHRIYVVSPWGRQRPWAGTVGTHKWLVVGAPGSEI